MRIIIIGASSSVGREVTNAFVEHGDTVLATYAKHPLTAPASVHVMHCDLEEPDTFRSFAQDAVLAIGQPDVVIFLAGILYGKNLPDYDASLMEEVMAINFTAQALLIQAFLPHMAAGGQMLIMTSISGERGSYDPIYAASKAALSGLMKSLATWHGDKVRFNCVSPALIEGTNMFDAMAPERRLHHKNSNPTKELLQSSDLAKVIVDLVQPHWRHLNGAVIRLNGGSYL